MSSVAAPALLGVAAAAALSLQVSPASASTTSHHVAASHHQSSVIHAQLTAASSYTVRSGDTLSSIAAGIWGNSADWPGLYQANNGEIQNPNLIVPGEVLTIPATASQASVSQPAQSEPTQSEPASSEPASSESATPAQTSAAPVQNSGSYSGTSAFQQCVISHESGGDSQVMNSSGHYGLYQFSASTWAAYGGNPGDFGNASVTEQNQVFANAMAAGGESNWAPYDGC